MNHLIPFKNFTLVRLNLASLLANPQTLHELAVLYCRVWTYDQNFGEYMVCPKCSRYYNKESVSNMKQPLCFGHNSPHPETQLIRAWIPSEVASNDLLGDLQKYKGKNLGVYALENETHIVIGFSWARLLTQKEINTKWGSVISGFLGYSSASYISDIGIDKEQRGIGLGKELLRILVSWIKTTAPNVPSFLRTHHCSPAYQLFLKAGYRYFTDDPQHGDGRVLMKIDAGKSLIEF